MSAIMTLFVCEQSFQATLKRPGTGAPVYRGKQITNIAMGMVLAEIEWTSDIGNLIWEGVLIALRAAGINTEAPL